MQHIEIVALLQESKKVIEFLQRRGTVELCECNDERLVKVNTASSVSLFEKNRTALQSALEVINRISPKKAGLLDAFKPKCEYEIHAFGKKAEKMEETMRIAQKVNALNKQIEDCQSEISRLTVAADSISQWLGYDMPLNFKGTKTTCAFLGSVPYFVDNKALKEKLGETAVGEVILAEKRQSNIFVIAHNSNKDDTEQILKDMGFVPFFENLPLTPKEYTEKCKADIEKLNGDIKTAIKTAAELAEYRADFEFFIDYFDMRKEKYAALNRVAMSQSTIIISGFIPQKFAPALIKEIEKKYVAAVSVFEPDEDEDVPVLLQNGGFSSPVEGITEMYALPGKRDVDPTPIMSFFYYLFFGMMLSDAGYGILMVIGTAVALKKFALSEKMRKTLKMFCYCGISTVFWGAMFGSWFGDIIQVVSREFFGKEIKSVALWFQPLDDPMKLLLFSFLLGILHLFLGLITNFVILWKRGEKWDAFCDVIPVMMTVAGVAPLAAGILTTGIPAIVNTVGKYMAIAGVVLLVLTAGRSSKSIFMRFFGGIYGLYNVATGYLSDILSYSRLLALGLATGSIASVINLIGTMPSNPVIKGIMLTLVFVVGHIANLAINLLGAYVHTDRLQFVELFSKFYEGGGRAFSPLKVNTNFIEIKEEINND